MTLRPNGRIRGVGNPYEPPIKVRLPPPPRQPWDEKPGGYNRPPSTVPMPEKDPFPGHTISDQGAQNHDAWAQLLVRDSDPSQTARMLKTAIDTYGAQGRADVADLLGRFQRIDAEKATGLQRELHKLVGERIPFRVAPAGEGFREPTEEEKIAAAPKSPFGSADGADRWAAANMAEALLGKGD